MSSPCTFASALAQQSEEVYSPDGGLRALVSDATVKELAFRPGVYDHYTETELASQLEQLAKLVFVARTRMRREALRQAMRQDERLERREAVSPAERRLREARKKTVVSDESPHIFASVEGGIHWDVEIEPGTIEFLDEDQFLAEFARLTKRIITHWLSEMRRLRDQEFGPSEILRSLAMAPSRSA